MKKKKKYSIDEQLQILLYEQYGDEFREWVQQFYYDDNYMHGTETIDKGYLEGRELQEYANEKWKEFLTKYGY